MIGCPLSRDESLNQLAPQLKRAGDATARPRLHHTAKVVEDSLQVISAIVGLAGNKCDFRAIIQRPPSNQVVVEEQDDSGKAESSHDPALPPGYD